MQGGQSQGGVQFRIRDWYLLPYSPPSDVQHMDHTLSPPSRAQHMDHIGGIPFHVTTRCGAGGMVKDMLI